MIQAAGATSTVKVHPQRTYITSTRAMGMAQLSHKHEDLSSDLRDLCKKVVCLCNPIRAWGVRR